MGNRDLKHARTAPRKPAKSGGGMLAGVLVGLILGVGLLGGAAFYMYGGQTPFFGTQQAAVSKPGSAASAAAEELLAPGTRLATTEPVPVVVPPKATISSAPVAKAPQDDEQRFDFYKILPGQVEAVPTEAPVAQKASTFRMYLQAGAFNNEGDADNMKAKLALMGVESAIQSSDVPEKGLLHRVRIGPFDTGVNLEPLRQRLKQDGIDVAIVKVPVNP